MNKIFKSIAAVSLLSATFGISHAATPNNSLVVAQNIDDIVSIDPAQAYEFSSGELIANIYDQLVQYDATNTTKLVPGLAESWTIDGENKVITFQLRDDVTFHSGNPLRAEDVEFSFERVVKLNKAPAFILTQLGWTPENVDAMVETNGANVVVKYTGEFAPSFVMNVLAARPASVVDAKLVASKAKDNDYGNAWLNRNTAGTGPFKLRTYRPAELVILDANKDYFLGAPKMKSIVIRHTAEAATQRLLLTSGDVDMAMNLTPDQVAGLQSNDDVRIERYPQAAVHFLSFNQKIDALTEKAIWEAARYLVDYEGMTQSLLNGQMQKHQAFWPKGFPGALTDTPYSYDVEKARGILKAAGVKLPMTISLDVINSAPFTDMAQALQATFSQVGINFEILPGTGAQVITKYRARTHEAMLLYWGPDFMDTHSNAKAFSYNANNADDNYQSTTTWRNGWQPSEELNTKTMAALSEQNADKRTAMYLELQEAVQTDSPIVIMFQATKQVAMNQKVKGFVNGAVSDYVFYRLVTK